jgi:hypothetical protein
MIAVSTNGWIGLGMFAFGIYVTLYAFGWLPASLSEGHDHPKMKMLRWFAPVTAVLGFLRFLFAGPW